VELMIRRHRTQVCDAEPLAAMLQVAWGLTRDREAVGLPDASKIMTPMLTLNLQRGWLWGQFDWFAT
jgi:hypothetical protein